MVCECSLWFLEGLSCGGEGFGEEGIDAKV